MALIATGTVTLIRHTQRETTSVDVFKSMRSMVHDILTKSSEWIGPDSYWGSREHLDALIEIENAIVSTREKVERELVEEAELEAALKDPK